MKHFIKTTLSVVIMVTGSVRSMELSNTTQQAEPKKVDLLWGYSKLSILQTLKPENLIIDGMPEYMHTQESIALFQEALLGVHKVVSITQEGSEEPKASIDTTHIAPFLAAISQLNKERQIWVLSVVLTNAMNDLRASAKPPHFLVNFDPLTNKDARLVADTENKLKSIDGNWKKIAEKLQQRRDEWQEKIAHCASKQPTMQELEETSIKEPAFMTLF